MELVPCAICGRLIAVKESYIVCIEVFADPAMPPTSAAELASTDFNAEISRLLDTMKNMSADDLQDQVHRRFDYRICASCQPRFLANPLGKPRIIQRVEN